MDLQRNKWSFSFNHCLQILECFRDFQLRQKVFCSCIKMSTSYKQRRQQIADLCVYGFIREQYSIFSDEDFPDDISNLCLLMYFILMDEWSLEDSCEGLQIDESNIISLSTPAHRFSQALGTIKVTKGDIYTWKFQTPSQACLGITDAEAYESDKGNNWSFHMHDAYGISAANGNKYDKVFAFMGHTYAKACCNNEVISMTLDMTGDKYATLSFKIDDKDYGIAVGDIDLSKEYRMIVNMFGVDQIKLLQ